MKVYVAGPYTHGDVGANVREAVRAADELFARGYTPFVPHLTHLWHLIHPRPHADWLRLDMEWLAVCQVVLRLPGDSPGADKECARARILGIPVVHSIAAIREARA